MLGIVRCDPSVGIPSNPNSNPNQNPIKYNQINSNQIKIKSNRFIPNEIKSNEIA
jgi:hypothetical protein